MAEVWLGSKGHHLFFACIFTLENEEWVGWKEPDLKLFGLQGASPPPRTGKTFQQEP